MLRESEHVGNMLAGIFLYSVLQNKQFRRISQISGTPNSTNY